MPGRRLEPWDNPLILANRKAKRLASLIRYYARQQNKEHLVPYVGAAVFLHARNMRSRLDPIGAQHIYGLDGHPQSGVPSLKDLLMERPWSGHAVDAQRGRQIVDLVRAAKIRPSVADRKIGQLLLFAKPFAEGIGWQDFLAKHVIEQSITRRVRFYLTSRAAAEDVPVIRRAAEREFRLLQGIQHPGVSQALDLADHSFGPAVIFNHGADSVRLDQWLLQHETTLTMAQRLHLVGDLAEIIAYAHSRRLAHRALSLTRHRGGITSPAFGRLSASWAVIATQGRRSVDPRLGRLPFHVLTAASTAPGPVYARTPPGEGVPTVHPSSARCAVPSRR